MRTVSSLLGPSVAFGTWQLTSLHVRFDVTANGTWPTSILRNMSPASGIKRTSLVHLPPHPALHRPDFGAMQGALRFFWGRSLLDNIYSEKGIGNA